MSFDHKPGWLNRQLRNVALDTALWPEWMFKATGRDLEHIPADILREAAAKLRARSYYLDRRANAIAANVRDSGRNGDVPE